MPPFNLQNKFEAILIKIEAMKARYQQSLVELESLYGSISQRAFKGELDVSRVSVEEVDLAKILLADKTKAKNSIGTKPAQTSKTEKPLKPFQQIQILGAVIDILEHNSMHHGEMVLAKYVYLLSVIYKIKTGFTFTKWHFGPYDPAIRKLINNIKYFRKTGKKGMKTYSIQNTNNLFKYNNKSVKAIRTDFPKLVSFFSQYSNPSERNHEIELMASVMKVIEEDKVEEPREVYKKLSEWVTDPQKTSGYKNKAEKFTLEETEDCLKVIKTKGWR